jgi:ABC-2 type transport system ATP-binding protein
METPKPGNVHRRVARPGLQQSGWATRALNDQWDADLAVQRLSSLDLTTSGKVSKLSGGQQAQLALTVALARRPRLLLLDEPLASLDPLARLEVTR